MARMTVMPAPPHQEAGVSPSKTTREEAAPLPSPAQEWVPNPPDRVLFLAIFLLSSPPSSDPCDGGLGSFSGAMEVAIGGTIPTASGSHNPLAFSFVIYFWIH